MDRVEVADVTLREHGQNVRTEELERFSVDLRAETARALVNAGVRRLEILSCVSPRVAPAMAESLIRRVAAAVGRPEGVTIVTLVPNRKGFEVFKRAGLGPDGLDHTLGMFFSAVEEHNRANLGRTINESLDECTTLAGEADGGGTKKTAYVSAAFGYRAEPHGPVIPVQMDALTGFVQRMFDLGAATVTLSDLQGVATPKETLQVLLELLDRLPRGRRERIGYHAHHASPDQALRRVAAAFEAGVRLFDASLGAAGGCVTGAPGNVPTEGVLDLFGDMGLHTGIDRNAVEAASRAFSPAVAPGRQ
jgi:hydroxymethylglutaryl-CoA lyase